MKLSPEDSASIARDLAALRPLAEACAQRPDTEATMKALRDLREATIRAAETIREAEFTARMERMAQFNREHA